MQCRHIVLRDPVYELPELLADLPISVPSYLFPCAGPGWHSWEANIQLGAPSQLWSNDLVGGYEVRVDGANVRLFDRDGIEVLNDAWFRNPGVSPGDYRGEPAFIRVGTVKPPTNSSFWPATMDLVLCYLQRGYLGPVYLRHVREDGFVAELFYAAPMCGNPYDQDSGFWQPDGYRAVPFHVVAQADPAYGGDERRFSRFCEALEGANDRSLSPP